MGSIGLWQTSQFKSRAGHNGGTQPYDADQDEAGGPGRIEVEPAARHELQAEIAIDQPGQQTRRRAIIAAVWATETSTAMRDPR